MERTTWVLIAAASVAVWWGPRTGAPSSPPPGPPAAVTAEDPPAPRREVGATMPRISFLPTDAPRRPPIERACNAPSPGGRDQVAIVHAARAGRCGEALDALLHGMQESPDHCALVPLVVRCFEDRHLEVLAGYRGVDDAEQLVPFLAHLEGDRGVRERLLVESPAWASLPPAYRPAPDGLERLLADLESQEELRRLVIASHGPTLADRVADILLIEARIATAMSATWSGTGATARRDAEIGARRVYVLGRTTAGPLGELLARYRPEVLGHALGVVREFDRSEVPPVVRDALDTTRLRP